MRVLRIACCAVVSTLMIAGIARGATLTVTRTTDDTLPGSLRGNIMAAQPGDTVFLPESPGHYLVLLGEITINKPLTIAGASANSSVIDALGRSRVFHVTAAPPAESTVTFQNVRITGGNTTSYPGGGAILVDPGAPGAPVDLRVLNAALTGNSASVSASGASAGGGAIYSSGGGITLDGSSLANNSATVSGGHCCHGGGAIYDAGLSGSAALTIARSQLTGNNLTVQGDPNDLTGSSGNCCSGGGAAYQNSDSSTTITASKLTANSATVNSGACCHGGGAVFLDYGRAANDVTTLVGSNLDGNSLTVNGPSAQSGSGSHCCSGGGAIATFLGFTATGMTMNGNHATVNSGDCCQGGGAAQVDSQNEGVSMYGSSLSGNMLTMSSSACCNGGGALQFNASGGSPGPLAAIRSLISGNRASFSGGAAPSQSGGGGIYESSPGGNSYTNSTIANNVTNVSGTDQGGGAVFMRNVGGAPDTLANATLSGNSAPAGAGASILSVGSLTQFKNSILARGGSAAQTCVGVPSGGQSASFTSLGYNLEDAPDSCGLTATGDKVLAGSSLGLGPLADNGGPTQTIALLRGSPAIDAGDPAGCTDPSRMLLETDQRGYPRPSGPRCDMGAFERQHRAVRRPRCKLATHGTTVSLRAAASGAGRAGHRSRRRGPRVSASINCNQAATVTLKGLFIVGRKPQRAKYFESSAVAATVRAAAWKRLGAKLPPGAVRALRAHKPVLLRYLLVVRNQHGTRYESFKVGWLVAKRV